MSHHELDVVLARDDVGVGVFSRERSARACLISNERHKGMHDGRGDAGEWRLAEASSRNTPAASHYSALRLLIGYTPWLSPLMQYPTADARKPKIYLILSLILLFSILPPDALLFMIRDERSSAHSRALYI